MSFRYGRSAGGSVTFAPPSGSIELGDETVEGTSGSATRADHGHAVPAPDAAPPAVDAVGQPGTSTTPARADHRHPHTADHHQAGGHADLTGTFAGAVHGHVLGELPADLLTGLEHDAVDHSGALASAVLGDLSDVDLTGASAGEVLTLGSTGAWEAISPAEPAPATPELLALVAFNPVGGTVNSTTATALTDVRPADLAITFTVPASGRVLVRLSALGRISAAGSDPLNQWIVWGLREGAADVAGSEATLFSKGANDNHFARWATTVVMAGLTAGAPHTWKWAHRQTAGAETVYLYMGGTYGPAVMEVWAA